MGCGASNDKNNRRDSGDRVNDTSTKYTDGNSRNDGKSESFSMGGRTQSMSMGNTSMSQSGIVGPGTPQTKSAGVPTHTMTDSRGFRVTTMISSRSKVETLCRWVDAVISNKPADNKPLQDPQELALLPKKTDKDLPSRSNSMASSAVGSTVQAPTPSTRSNLDVSQASTIQSPQTAHEPSVSMQTQDAGSPKGEPGDEFPTQSPRAAGLNLSGPTSPAHGNVLSPSSEPVATPTSAKGDPENKTNPPVSPGQQNSPGSPTIPVSDSTEPPQN